MALPRVFISTDLRLRSEEKDDAQSLIHALMYQDKMNIVGISATASRWNIQDGLVGDVDHVIDVYGRDLGALREHGSAFKSVAALKAVTWQGATDTAPSAGWSRPTDGSKAIIAQAKAAAAAGETLNVLTWGGETDMAQALHDDPSIASHVRYFNIHTQDLSAYRYIRANFKNDFDMWVDDQTTFKGMYASPSSNGIIKGWHEANARDHGALGDFFSQLSGDIFNASGVKMGDSPTVLRFIMGNQNDPAQESWGGEFVKAGDRYWTDNPSNSLDFDRPATDGAWTIYEDRAEWMGDFARRFDWLKGEGGGGGGGDGGGGGGGGGPDTITVKVSGDAYRGDPNFALTLDGKVIDATNLVTADNGEGEWQTFTFTGDFDLSGTDSVGIRFTNDHYEGSASRDRNLYVDEVTLNGDVNDTDEVFYRTTTAYWDF